MRIFRQFFKSIYSPQAIARTRFQKIGIAILYVFLLSFLAALPSAFNMGTTIYQASYDFKDILERDIPDFSIKDGQLSTAEKAPVEGQAGQFMVVLDPASAYDTEQIEAKQNAAAFLKDKFVIATDGQAMEFEYTMFPSDISKNEILDLSGQLQSFFVPVLIVLIFFFSAASKFIEVSLLAVLGILIKNMQGKSSMLPYKQLWTMAAYSATLATVFFAIMTALHTEVPSPMLLNWFVHFMILFLAVKEIPTKRT
ncbi:MULTISPECIES: DUF1189 domain-containing protein [Bacillus]|uniref:DUF1189 domain-containing protein n=2 Tax=Bacillus TaxID=1386 RepID=A0A0M5JLP1_9BACI|nr:MULTISPECIES: DUF1189 domain-containing protein [Bacillus]ALC81639.1 hypothetical protein AM592_08495 [Bacillus gobiensis]MBP1080685.1 hypothetical protein [Bacillus capparidis]MED1094541.1 DUF1189 domain-containing protein [Bacillus capparidis]